jgi:hypothetical protein
MPSAGRVAAPGQRRISASRTELLISPEAVAGQDGREFLMLSGPGRPG